MSALDVGFSVIAFVVAAAWAGGSQRPRDPAHAGTFYPEDATRLRRAVMAYLQDAVAARPEMPIALVAPHAGYIFSGQIAADAYRQVQGRAYDVVVILGTDHSGLAAGRLAVYPGAGFRTPLGVATADHDVAAALAAADPLFVLDAAPHEREHSIEVQVPFLQVALPAARIVPIVVGLSDPAAQARAGKALAAVLNGRRALVVASSDLAHYPAYRDAVASDSETLRAMASLDPAKLRTTVERQMRAGRANLLTCACGEAPATVAMEAARALGATHGVALSYANSGDTGIPERSRVVGYGAVLFAAGEGRTDTSALERPAGGPIGRPLSEEENHRLLDLARDSLARLLDTGTLPLLRRLPNRLLEPQGVFVTLRKKGSLRGCTGVMEATLPVAQAVQAMAVQAGFGDPRFPELQPPELAETRIEISLLSPLSRAKDPAQIVVGRDGVVLRSRGHTGVFLPEVAVEQGWDRGRLLQQLGLKAGLDADAWRTGELLTFQTVAIREPE